MRASEYSKHYKDPFLNLSSPNAETQRRYRMNDHHAWTLIADLKPALKSTLPKTKQKE